MASETTYSLDQFLADTRATIKSKGIPAGLAEIRDHLEVFELGLDRHPELRDAYFAHYTRMVWLAQQPDAELHDLAQRAAECCEIVLHGAVNGARFPVLGEGGGSAK